jgi:hypothetical protein
MTFPPVLVLALLLALGLPAAAQAEKRKPKPERYLVSLGDSYAAGWQVIAPGVAQNTRNGFAYGPLDQVTTLDPYGVLPVPVARVCELTYYCEFRDTHARTNGHTLIARLLAKTLPKRR